MRIVRDGDDTLFFDTRELRLAIHEVAVSLFSLAPDAATELMELREAKILWVNDDDRIGPQEIYPVFDDGRGEEDRVFSLLKCMDTILDLFTGHLTVSDDNVWFLVLCCLFFVVCSLFSSSNIKR